MVKFLNPHWNIFKKTFKMEKIIFPQFSKRWKIPKKISFELSNHPSSCTGSPSANTQRTTNASQRDLSIRVGEVANLHAIWRFSPPGDGWQIGGVGLQPQPIFPGCNPNLISISTKKNQVSQNYFLGRIPSLLEFTYFFNCCQEKVQTSDF